MAESSLGAYGDPFFNREGIPGMKALMLAAALALLTALPASAGSMVASWYGPETCSKHRPCRTANGEAFRPDGLTCAHRMLPFGTMLRVTYRGRTAVCRVNDRGPFIRGRQLDLSRGTARAIGVAGVAIVGVEVLAR